MASTFLKDNFASLRKLKKEQGANIGGEDGFKFMEEDDEEDIIKGVISNKEMKLLKSLLPK